jgi:hypothetical protein
MPSQGEFAHLTELGRVEKAHPETPSRAVLRSYDKRGTAGQWIGEGKQAVKMTRLSWHHDGGK